MSEHRSERQRVEPRGREHRPSASEGGADRPVREAHEAGWRSGANPSEARQDVSL